MVLLFAHVKRFSADFFLLFLILPTFCLSASVLKEKKLALLQQQKSCRQAFCNPSLVNFKIICSLKTNKLPSNYRRKKLKRATSALNGIFFSCKIKKSFKQRSKPSAGAGSWPNWRAVHSSVYNNRNKIRA